MQKTAYADVTEDWPFAELYARSRRARKQLTKVMHVKLLLMLRLERALQGHCMRMLVASSQSRTSFIRR